MERYPKHPTETMPKSGKVSEVVQEWLVKEDGALATRLQNEEITDHYEKNRFRNGLLRTDLPRARVEQFKADEEAAYSEALQEQMLFQQYAADADIARRMALEAETEQERQRRQQEVDDYQLASRLQEEEKARRRQEREERQVSHEARMLGLEAPVRALRLASPPGAERVYPDDDLSDLMAPPPNHGLPLSEDDVRSWQEEQDEEVARLLQEQETKRRGDVMPRDKVAAIEAQDRELAKVLQEQERARLRRAKERAREKRRMRQRAAGSGDDLSTDSGAETGVKLRADDGDGDCCGRRDTSPLPAGSDPAPSGATSSGTGRPWPREPGPLARDTAGERLSPPPRSAATSRGGPGSRQTSQLPPLPTAASQSPGGVNNIAMMIDPTYQRRVSAELPPPEPQEPQEPPLQELEDEYEDDDESLAPPYMPIQGQRRLNVAEKGKRRRAKDGSNCKQQ